MSITHVYFFLNRSMRNAGGKKKKNPANSDTSAS